MSSASASSSGRRLSPAASAPAAHLRALLSGALDFLLPRECPLCGDRLRLGSPRVMCQPCLDGLERLQPPWCPCCGKPFPSGLTLSHSPDHLCAGCRENHPGFDLARAIGPMEGQLRELVHLYKFQGRSGIAWELGPLLGRLAEEEMSGWPEGTACVTHVPISPARWRERGFDQSELLARRTADWLGLPFEPLLERRKETSPQTGLPGRQRRRNLQGVFGMSAGRKIEGERVLLVDDVLTTGSTASACARVLRKAGAMAVGVVTICTVLPGKWTAEEH